MISNIPLYFYPTEIVMVDDDQALAQAIVLKLRHKNFRMFHHPNQAQQYFNSLPPDAKNSVLLVDYHMPEMTGLQLLASIHQPALKKILMTSEQDYKIAVDAFNQGLIQGYLRKDEPHFIERLSIMIDDMTWQYFAEKTMAEVLVLGEYTDFFRDAACVKWFQQLLVQQSALSFAWQDTIGGFVLHHAGQKTSQVLVRSLPQLKTLAQAAQEDGASAEVVEQIGHGKALPFFGENTPYWKVKANEWYQYLYPASGHCGAWIFFNIAG